ncbi:MAG: GntR family transcriptional regulator [Bacilli bacterium]|jgi:GntR family transcriptional regulator
MSKLPIYREIFETYKQYIILEILKPGERLPSIRELATEKGINPNTVSRSYSLLEEAGYIEAIPQKGFFVREQKKDNKVLLQSARSAIKIIKKTGLSYEKLTQIVSEIYQRGNEK